MVAFGLGNPTTTAASSHLTAGDFDIFDAQLKPNGPVYLLEYIPLSENIPRSENSPVSFTFLHTYEVGSPSIKSSSSFSAAMAFIT